MQHVVELELRSRPLSSPTPLNGRAVADKCRQDIDLPATVVLGLNYVPDEIDSVNLLTAIANREFSLQEFSHHCEQQMLKNDPTDKVSAASFLAYVEGQPLAWLHIPATSEGQIIAKRLSTWATKNGFHIVLGQGKAPLTTEQISNLWSTT